MIGLMVVAAVATSATPRVVGDFDGDGRADTATITTAPSGAQQIAMTFATGASATADWRQGGASGLHRVPATQVAQLCDSPIDRRLCPPRLPARDALAFTAADGQLTALVIWTGREVMLIVGLTAEQGQPFRAPASLEATKPPQQSAPPGSAVATQLILSIDAAGRVSGCRVATSSGTAALDDRACAVARSTARYRAAVNAAGQPIASTRQLRVTWRPAGSAAATGGARTGP